MRVGCRYSLRPTVRRGEALPASAFPTGMETDLSAGSSLRGRGWCPADLHATRCCTQSAQPPSLTSSLFIALRWLNEASVYLLFSIHEFHRVLGYLSDTRRASTVLNDVLHRSHENHLAAILLIRRISYPIKVFFYFVNCLQFVHVFLHFPKTRPRLKQSSFLNYPKNYQSHNQIQVKVFHHFFVIWMG
jgi:hypothetical protein